MPHLLHLKFKLDPLNDPQWSRHFVDLVFWLNVLPLDGELDFYSKNDFIFKKMTWSCHLFLFYF